MIGRNRNKIVSNDDINKLESKIKDLENQIHSAKAEGEIRKQEKLEESLNLTASFAQYERPISNDNL
jgi:uncharacterized protein YlxW (UPF0749 family)